MSDNDNRPAPTAWPCLTYDDAPAAISVLTEVFGFTELEVVRAGEDGSTIVHAELLWPPGGGIMLGSTGQGSLDWPAGTGAVYCVCDDPDKLFEQATAAGLDVVLPLKDEDYGSRGFTVRDPEGNHWTFGTYRGAPLS